MLCILARDAASGVLVWSKQIVQIMNDLWFSSAKDWRSAREVFLQTLLCVRRSSNAYCKSWSWTFLSLFMLRSFQRCSCMHVDVSAVTGSVEWAAWILLILVSSNKRVFHNIRSLHWRMIRTGSRMEMGCLGYCCWYWDIVNVGYWQHWSPIKKTRRSVTGPALINN